MAEERDKHQLQLEKLKAIDAKGTSTNKTIFDLIVCTGGAPVKEHYPYVRDKNGNKKLDESGNPIKSDTRDGFLYTFSNYQTGDKVLAVISEKYSLEPLNAFRLHGLGYRMRNSNLYYIDEATKLTNL